LQINGALPKRRFWKESIRNLEKEMANDDIHYGRPIGS
jgi:hypothetical protein